MEGCARCAAFRLGQTDLWRALDAWAPAPVSANFNRRLWQRIDEINHAPWHRRLADALRLRAWKPLFPLAAAAIVITAGYIMDHPRPAQESTGVSVSEADQVERGLEDMQLLRQFEAASRPM
jgi:hypothetical protein